MIQFDITQYLNNINIIQMKDGFLTVERINEDEMDANLVEFINYVKVHSPTHNIKALIQEYKRKLRDIEIVEEVLTEILVKFLSEGKFTDPNITIFEIRISCGMKADISLNNLDNLSNWHLSERFITDVANLMDKKKSLLGQAIFRFSEFLSITLKDQNEDESYFSNPQIAIAFQILFNNSKRSEYNITDKNASLILKTYSKGHSSIPVFLRTVAEYRKTSEISRIDKSNKTSATRKKNNLLRAKELILKIDKSNAKAIANINEILRKYIEEYSTIDWN